MSQKSVKAKIRGVEKTRQVTKAMEAVSAAKMRKAQERALSLRPYAISALRILTRIGGDRESLRHPLLIDGKGKNVLFIILVSDRGLAGSLNSGVLRKVSATIKAEGFTKDTVEIIALGKKAIEFSKKEGLTIILERSGIPDAVPLKTLEEAATLAKERFLKGEVKKVYIAYSNFVSTFFQEGIVHTLLPLQLEEVRQVVEGIVPVKGKYSDFFIQTTDTEVTETRPYLFEPSLTSVLDTLLSHFLSLLLFHGALEGKASEHSARMVAMKSAGDKAKEMKKELVRAYNKVRQGAITREVSEIIGGIEALKV